MEKTQKFNQEIVKQLVILYQAISKANSLDSEIVQLLEDKHPGKSEFIERKYENFFSTYRDVSGHVGNHLALGKNFSTIFEDEINALAIEQKVLTQKPGVNPIGKKYFKLRIYYKAVDNRFSKSSHGYSYPNFGMLLVCSLSFNDRIFKFEIAKTEKGCDKYCPCEVNAKNQTITTKSIDFIFISRKEFKFCSEEKFAEALNICETITEMVNAELEKAGLEKFISNIEVNEE